MSRRLAGLLSLAVLTLAACEGDPGADGGDEDELHEVEVRGTRTAFTLTVDEQWGITDVDEDWVCGGLRYDLGDLHVEALPRDCPEAGQDTEIGNGKHGLYRTLEDVPEPQGVETVETGLGPAEVFEQDYYECTNSCETWSEPVAIVTLSDPRDPAYPTLVLRGFHDDLDRAELETLLDTLAAPYEPSGS